MKNSFDYFNEMQMLASAEKFAEPMLSSTLISERLKLHRWLINYVLDEVQGSEKGLFAEFGVFEGESINLFGRVLATKKLRITGFDAFMGIEENWDADRLKGRYARGGNAPKIEKNVDLEIGWVQDTLPGYLKTTTKKTFSFVHLDMDTYTPTKYTLEAIRSRCKSGTVILFDELHGYPQWKAHEYKALCEVLQPTEYKFIAFGLQQAAIQLL